jgi:hypothetical protein
LPRLNDQSGLIPRRVLLDRGLVLLFPVALLLSASYFLGGTGWWSDDYWHNLRDPVTGDLGPTLIISREFFLRPLFYRIVPPLTTLLWNHDWAAHLLQVFSHGIVTLLLFLLLRTFAIGPRPAAAAAILFMLFPPHFEAVLWFSALPTSLATMLMLGLMFTTIAFARRAGPLACRGGWWIVPLMMAAAFAICCLNEQPAAGILALPLVYLAALATHRPRSLVAQTPVSHFARALVPTFLSGCMVILYAAIVRATAVPGSRGSSAGLIAPGELAERLPAFSAEIVQRLTMQNFAGGAFSLGLGELRAAPLAALGATLVLIAAAIPFIRWWVAAHPGPSTHAEPTPPPRAIMLLALTGLAIFATGYLPIAVVAGYSPDSRTHYWPAIGLALIIAALGSAAPCTRPLRTAALAVLLVVSAAASTTFIGLQSAYRTRHRQDLAESARLRELIPDPEPLTFFLPLAIETTAIRTGSALLDSQFRGVWEYPWATPRHIMRVYQRDDVRCGSFRHWTPGHPTLGASEQGIHYGDRLGPRFPQIADNVWLIPWERVIPFVITGEGQLRIVTRLVLESPGVPPLEVPIPQVTHLPDFPAALPRRFPSGPDPSPESRRPAPASPILRAHLQNPRAGAI